MWMQRDFDLNSVQKFADSKEEVIKQTMVKQDMAFRNQVYGLLNLWHMLNGEQYNMKNLYLRKNHYPTRVLLIDSSRNRTSFRSMNSIDCMEYRNH